MAQGFVYFNPVSTMPLMICRWKIRKTTSTGMVASAAEAMIRWKALPDSDEKNAIPTGKVRISSERVTISGQI